MKLTCDIFSDTNLRILLSQGEKTDYVRRTEFGN